MSGRIVVYINEKEISLYSGMRVRHALTLKQVHLIESGKAEVRDSYGHVAGLDGALRDGERFTFYRKNK